MNLSLVELQATSLYEFSSESDLIKSIEKVSNSFVFDRNSIGEYRDDPKLVTAYYNFYFPTNVLKMKELFSRLDSSLIESFLSHDFIDFGCGPGTFGSGFLDYFPQYDKTVYEVDISRTMLEQAKKSQEHLFPGKDIVYIKNYKKIKTDKPVLFFGNSANEMSEKLIQEVIKFYDPEYLIFMEPGTKDSFFKVLKIREYLLENGHNSLYPCSSNNDCQLKNQEKDWCHQYFKVNYEPCIERISQKLKKDRRNLPVISHVFSKTKITHNFSVIIRSFAESKFGKEFEVCTGENKIQRIEILYRGYSKKEKKSIDNLLSGEQVSFEIIKEIKENTFRVKLTCNID
jgi:SAM-dependent methyltransferase